MKLWGLRLGDGRRFWVRFGKGGHPIRVILELVSQGTITGEAGPPPGARSAGTAAQLGSLCRHDAADTMKAPTAITPQQAQAASISREKTNRIAHLTRNTLHGYPSVP